MKRLLYIPLVLLALPACGDDAATGDDSMDPDADPGACAGLGTPAGTISAYPGTFSGSVVGGGADLTAPDMTCTVNDYFDAVIGEDVVVSLTGLTAGAKYAVIVDSTDDLAFYVLSGCDIDAGVVQGACDVFEDVSSGGEEHTFTASGETAYVVVDTILEGTDLATGDFELRVIEAQCEASTECSGGTPQCVGYQCVECATDFDCDAGTPSCDQTTNECVAGFSSCTGDDAADSAAPGDDGPLSATALTLPADVNTPTVVNASICSVPASEADYYTFTVTGDVTYGFGLTWASATTDLDVYILDDAGEFVEGGLNVDQTPEAFTVALGAGTYYVYVTQYGPAATAAAAAYTLTFSVPECLDDFDCTMNEPVCGGAGTCGVSTGACTNDDAGDTSTGGDDGPTGGRDLSGTVGTPSTLTGNGICNATGEVDYYQVTVAAGENLTVTLDWADDTKDLDVLILDASNFALGVSYWLRPEVVDLTYLPAGTYYLAVTLYDPDNDITDASTVPYSITTLRTATAGCGTVGVGSSTCATEFSTQVYRGECLASGACGKYDGAGAVANGAACDTADDCTSGRCSYILFEKDANLSVCTTTCTSSTDCTAISGTTCTTGFSTNVCVPACADNLACGAQLSSSTLDSNEPWDYLTCTNPGASGTCGTP